MMNPAHGRAPENVLGPDGRLVGWSYFDVELRAAPPAASASEATPDDNGAMSAVDAVELEVVGWDGAGRAEIVARVPGGAMLHRDQLDPGSAKKRAEFANRLRRAGVLDSAAERAERAIAAMRRPAPVAPERAEGARYDSQRPTLFLHPKLCGATVYRVVLDEGSTRAVPEFVFKWADGRREIVPCRSYVDLGDLTYLVLDPRPEPVSTRTVKQEWSDAGVRRWLDGAEDSNPARAFADVLDAVTRAVYFTGTPGEQHGQAVTLALWILLTYFVPGFSAVPYVHFAGPKGSGKTTAFDILEALAFRPQATASATAATVFRAVHAIGGTFLFDEAETLGVPSESKMDLLAIVNSGYKKGGTANRCAGDDHRVEQYDTYGPKAFASIKDLPPALASRCLRFQMLRRPACVAPVERRGDTQAIRDRLMAMALDHGPRLLELAARPVRVPGVVNRDLELWAPLVVIAQLVDEAGAGGVADEVVGFAQDYVQRSADFVADDRHALVLGALLEMLEAPAWADGRFTAGAILAKLKEEEPGEWDGWGSRSITKVCRDYQLAPRKIGGNNFFVGLTVERVRGVMASYGMLPAAPDAVSLPTSPARSPMAPEPAPFAPTTAGPRERGRL